MSKIRRSRSMQPGKRIHRLVCVRRVPSITPNTRWLFQCDCGNTKVADACRVLHGHVKSCGCYRRESSAARRRTHGKTETCEFKCWSSMKHRILNPSNREFHNYGGRGISICDRWLNSFENFLSDMGLRPNGMSLDRIDNNGNYCPENCRWATTEQQHQNTRTNVLHEYDGRTQCASAWARELGIPSSTLWGRMKRGLNLSEAANLTRRVARS